MVALKSCKQQINQIRRFSSIPQTPDSVITQEFAKDADRLARFEREAKMLASLNHPNIAAIHGFEQDGETHFLVLELVEGDTLADQRVAGWFPRGSWAPDDTIVLGRGAGGLARVPGGGDNPEIVATATLRIEPPRESRRRF